MEEITVPPYFLCPISLEIMKDPVTVPTGITYDRRSIEKWLYKEKNATCPVTKQSIENCELTPNHMLRQLIQSWCILNASYGVERIPTPKPLVSKAKILTLLKESKSRQQKVNCLKNLRCMANEHESNKLSMKSAGVSDFLISIMIEESDTSSLEVEEFSASPSEEALSILHSLHVSDSSFPRLARGQHVAFIEALTTIMRCGSYESRGFAAMMVKWVIADAGPVEIFSLSSNLFVEMLEALKDQISVKTVLKVLVSVCPWGGNRAKAVRANAVRILVDLLLDTSDRRMSEMIMALMEVLCQCPEGRAELTGHAAGLAVVSKKMLRVSDVCTERCIGVISSVAKQAPTTSVLQEMLEVGVVAKLCLLLQVSCGKAIKKKAKEMLKLHARVWKESPCIPAKLIFFYPS